MQSQSARLPLPAPRRTRRCAREVEYRPRAKRPTLNLRVPLFCCLLIALVASAAYAEGINLSWNDCGFSGGENRNFACNSNFGENVMVASFDPPSGITKLVGSSATLELQTTSTPLPSWWQLASGGCREGALRLELAAPASPNCVDYWSSAAAGSFSYVGGGAANRARITVSFGIPEALAGPVDAGTEYYAFQLIFNNAKSVGAGSCPGCFDPTCIVLTSIWLYQPPGAGDQLCNPHTRNWVTWQPTIVGCPGGHEPRLSGDCGATPAIHRTWGLIKTLYR